MAVDKLDRNYESRDLNRVFAIGSLVLFVTVILMIADDYSRQWKNYQRRFQADEARRTERAIKEAERAMNSAEMKRLQEELKKAEAELAKRKGEYESVQKRLKKIDAEVYGKDLDSRFAKATFDSARYSTEVEIEHLRQQNRLTEANAKQAELDRVKKKM